MRRCAAPPLASACRLGPARLPKLRRLQEAASELTPPSPPHPTRRYGVAASLDELVQAPPLVMQVLTSGPPALASAFIMGDESRIDELLE